MHTHTHRTNLVKSFVPFFCFIILNFFPHNCDIVNLWPFASHVLHSRRPGVRVGLLHHGQRFISGHRQLEGEGRGRGRGHPHRSGAEQNWPAGTDRCKEVSQMGVFLPLKTLQFNLKTTIKTSCSRHSEEAEALAKRLKLRFYRASVKEDLNVTEGERPLRPTDDQLHTFYLLSLTHAEPTGCLFSFQVLGWQISPETQTANGGRDGNHPQHKQ